jgi:hypothetical protein
MLEMMEKMQAKHENELKYVGNPFFYYSGIHQLVKPLSEPDKKPDHCGNRGSSY